MDAERHQRLTEIFSKASGLGPGEREAFLDEVCAGDVDLREEVESLLALEDPAEEFLGETAMGHHLRAMLEDSPDPDVKLPPPDRVGPYSILDVLGEGSQGIVFKARQQTPRRVVALKVLRAGSFAAADDLRRFHNEIQALALLRHPAIATIYDGGHTDEGHHYFTMELVDGTPINEYVRKNSLSLKQRLELFCKVCDGIDHAHQKGAIHRDLKPTNILVDADGNPKILDFGLVRLIDAGTTNVPVGSETGFIVGSFGYMSPEQARGRREDINTQTDVYSLGMILYELLTDARPYEVGSSVPEAVRAICEVSPAPPSAKKRELRGDIDTIVATALDKDCSRRYGSVAQLVGDIRCFLRGDPISARPASLAYVLRKKIRRHRVALALFLAAFVVGGIWLGFRARAMRRDFAIARQLAIETQWLLERSPAERNLGRAHSLYEDNPTVPEAGLVATQAVFRAGVQHGPIYYVQQGIARGRHAWAYRLLLAQGYRETNLELAEQVETRALLEFPDTAEAWYLRSFTTFDLHEAIRCANVAIEKDADHIFAVARKAYLCERVADFDCAHAAVDRVLESRRSEHRRNLWLRFRSVLLMKQGEYHEAVGQFDSLLAMYPDRHRYHTDRALAYLCMKEYAQAVADYTAVIESGDSPGSWSHMDSLSLASWSHMWRAAPLWMLGKREEALRDYETFRRMHRLVSYTDARLFLLRQEHARFLEGQGRPADAGNLVEKAGTDLRLARLDAEAGSWLRKILDCLAEARTPEELIQAADRSSQEQVSEAYYYAAEVSLLAGRIKDARRWFRDCVATGLMFDVNEFADPMSEYHLARWRVGQLGDG